MWWALLDGGEAVDLLGNVGFDRVPPEDERLRRIVDALRSLRLLGLDATAGQLAVAAATQNVVGGVTKVDPVNDLNLTAGASYDQTQQQAILDKVDELLAALRTAGVITS